ncbi:MAG TPA: DUF4112 domain-containing protein, partial [Gemmatimonadales bacterium]|nr:DUF4112 domain-containing protein [Gemmatimonadales bacterium]
EPKPGDDRTATLRRLTWLLDDAIRLPFGFRIGLDAIIGLFPGLGDAIGGAAALYGLGVAWKLGAPPVVLTRMVMNASVDAMVGAIPLLGDLWDAGFASHRRNLAILEHWLATPDPAARGSKWVLLAAAGTLVLTLLAALALAIWVVVWVAGLLLPSN